MTRVVIVGGGIAGLTVAERLSALTSREDVHVELREATERTGGKLKTSPFAGRAAIDEGADAFLARVPAGVGLARRVGLGDALTSPTGAPAAVWHHGLHRIPDGLMLGVPGGVAGLATSRLLSVRGKLRAAVEPLLPRSADPHDSIGSVIRARFGDEVHERLVDSLVGSIYATDTDRFSLAMVPQLAELADGNRSLLLAARALRRSRPPTGDPIFYAPATGMEALAAETRAAAERGGVTVRTGSPVATLERDGDGWRVDDERADAVVLATPAALTAPLVAAADPDLADRLAAMDHAGVVIVTLAVPDWPERLRDRSGYLVPKPVQRLVTAASFGSQKWSHWQGDGEVLRVSLGRDGLDVLDRSDDDLVAAAVAEVGEHVGIDLQPTAVRITRWPAAFPQYRPGHRWWLDAVAAATPPGLFLTGASYRGIGVPACIADAEAVAADVRTVLVARGASA
jgi:oxygen-dependent protoporphyrinogen oxidase